MYERYIPQQLYFGRREKKEVEDNHNHLPENNIKDLHLAKPKNHIMEEIQSKLAMVHDVKVLDKTLFYLVCYISHYEEIYNIVNSGLNNVEIFVDNFKNNQSPTLLKKKQSNSDDKEASFLKKEELHKSRIQYSKSKLNLISHTERLIKSSEVQVIMDSYRYKCLKEFFHIEKYSEKNISETIFNTLHEKIVKDEITAVESIQPISIKKISMISHKKHTSQPKTLDETENTIKNNTFLPEIKSQKANLSKSNSKLRKKPSRFETECSEESKTISTSRSLEAENRMNGINEVNKISIEIEKLKKVLKNSLLEGDEVTNIASDIKLKLNNILNNIKVRPINHHPKIKENKLLKVR